MSSVARCDHECGNCESRDAFTIERYASRPTPDLGSGLDERPVRGDPVLHALVHGDHEHPVAGVERLADGRRIAVVGADDLGALELRGAGRIAHQQALGTPAAASRRAMSPPTLPLAPVTTMPATAGAYPPPARVAASTARYPEGSMRAAVSDGPRRARASAGSQRRRR